MIRIAPPESIWPNMRVYTRRVVEPLRGMPRSHLAQTLPAGTPGMVRMMQSSGGTYGTVWEIDFEHGIQYVREKDLTNNPEEVARYLLLV